MSTDIVVKSLVLTSAEFRLVRDILLGSGADALAESLAWRFERAETFVTLSAVGVAQGPAEAKSESSPAGWSGVRVNAELVRRIRGWFK